MSLFEPPAAELSGPPEPLAARMRPATLDEFVGQEEILGPGRLLRRAIETDRLFSSILLWGPPGSGKTTLARVIANRTQSAFETISAVLAGLPELRQVITRARERRKHLGQRTILFVDEVHRWNRAQQDALLPLVENGTLVLVGATTENPYFEVIAPLVSRSRVFRLGPLGEPELRQIVFRALRDPQHGYGSLLIRIDEEAITHLVQVAGGDARNALNALELAVESTTPGADGSVHIDLSVAQDSIQRRALLYDREGEAHYDTISAFIKSVRGSDPDAALYWLARMLHSGEDPRFILRRLLILAGEDIGLADPNGLVVASAAAQGFEYVGMPEGVYLIVEATLYLATAAKSNSAGAYFSALESLETSGVIDVPRHLQDASRDAAALGHGAGYQYPHEFPGHHIGQQYLPTMLMGSRFYQPSEQGYEAMVKERLTRWREAQDRVLAEGRPASPSPNPRAALAEEEA
ncbi:MAG: AAA family ATPase [Anaerolineales bacterium]|jgi:putative ATPase